MGPTLFCSHCSPGISDPGTPFFCLSFSYCATAEVIALPGATPVFIDVERATYNMDPERLKTAIAQVVQSGKLNPRDGIIVNLFGQCADCPALTPIIRDASLKVISDCAQGFGSTLDGQHPLAWADVQTNSFFQQNLWGATVMAARYSTGLKDVVSRVPTIRSGVVSTWAQYTIEVEEPIKFTKSMQAKDIPTARYYPLPIHR